MPMEGYSGDLNWSRFTPVDNTGSNYNMFKSGFKNVTAASNFDAQTGLPHHCRVLVEFKPLFMLTQQDLDTLFINPSASTPLSCDATYSLPGVASAAKNLFSSF
jgi:hypothetical protein